MYTAQSTHLQPTDEAFRAVCCEQRARLRAGYALLPRTATVDTADAISNRVTVTAWRAPGRSHSR
jgi:hypothetical protein